jgi:hypothetical protein
MDDRQLAVAHSKREPMHCAVPTSEKMSALYIITYTKCSPPAMMNLPPATPVRITEKKKVTYRGQPQIEPGDPPRFHHIQRIPKRRQSSRFALHVLLKSAMRTTSDRLEHTALVQRAQDDPDGDSR